MEIAKANLLPNGAPILHAENQVVNIDAQKIAEIYHQFQKDGDLTNLDKALVCKGEIEKTYKQLWETNQTKTALEFKKMVLDPAERQLQAINAASKNLTKVDMRNIGTFFTPPIELYYIDETTGLTYFKPDSSNLLKGVGQLFLQEIYQGSGLNKNLSLIHPKKKVHVKCDVLYFKKPLAIAEKSFSIRKFLGFDTSQNQDALQKNFLQKAKTMLEEKFEQWKYESFIIADSQGLVDMGMLSKDASNLDAIVFFHQFYSEAINEDQKSW